MALAASPNRALRADADRHGRELFRNHLWESLNALAKILLFAIVTPLMLRAWGRENFGLFALGNSCFALMVFLDFGLRTLTRVGLSRPDLSEPEKARLHAQYVGAFGLVAAGGLSVILWFAWSGLAGPWLNLPAGGNMVLASTSALALGTMFLQILLEPIAASGRLSRIKATMFVGNVLASVALLATVRGGVGVVAATAAYFAALALPLLFLLPQAQPHWRDFVLALVRLRARDIPPVFSAGLWINAITGSWLLQSYGLIFLISWAGDLAEAGKFFLFLKLSELLSVLGASASEPTIAALAAGRSPAAQRERLATGYRSAVALCLAGAVGCAFFCSDLFSWWLGVRIDPAIGFLIGMVGVSSGFGRMVTAASLGLGRPRPVALSALLGAAVTVAAVVAGYDVGGAPLILGAGAVTGLFFLPTAALVSRQLGGTFTQIWMRPVVQFLPWLGAIALLCAGAAYFPSRTMIAIAVAGSALLTLLHIVRRPGLPSSYDTRSRRSAFFMRALDLLRPPRRAQPFRWADRCVVSSAAGLGDLFVQLPLVAGIVTEAQRRGCEVRVALRPAHLAIGKACGWEVVPFDNALEDFFKNPWRLKPIAVWRGLRASRRHRAGLWIDLTGNAVSALAIQICGARRIAARTTRGGGGLIDHPLPHVPGENEYRNTERVADFLGCVTERDIFARLRGTPLPGLQDAVILCLTTICRWRNWPLSNFLTLVDRFPETRFVASGLRREVAPEDERFLEEILSRPNAISCLDRLDMPKLIRLIAHSRAVITNDTSTAHIANGFGKPGVVLFGPASPDKFGADFGLRNFVDRSCPLHPCVQWTCGNQANWCMRKISAAEVGDHLATILEPSYATAARVA